jgi:hypothetical protein
VVDACSCGPGRRCGVCRCVACWARLSGHPAAGRRAIQARQGGQTGDVTRRGKSKMDCFQSYNTLAIDSDVPPAGRTSAVPARAACDAYEGEMQRSARASVRSLFAAEPCIRSSRTTRPQRQAFTIGGTKHGCCRPCRARRGTREKSPEASLGPQSFLASLREYIQSTIHVCPVAVAMLPLAMVLIRNACPPRPRHVPPARHPHPHAPGSRRLAVQPPPPAARALRTDTQGRCWPRQESIATTSCAQRLCGESAMHRARPFDGAAMAPRWSGVESMGTKRSCWTLSARHACR